MDLFKVITQTYANLKNEDFHWINGTIKLFDDGDGKPYIKEWNYSEPIPDGLKLGK